MSSIEAIRELYERCKELDLDESTELALRAETIEEQDFFEMVSNYFLQIRQRKVILEGKF
ncbi:MAG: hypothetical protein IJ468_13645 [Lachnospiraceae bacterium]|nr:hypothetical protein [Lachnospiraceae bacterium]